MPKDGLRKFFSNGKLGFAVFARRVGGNMVEVFYGNEGEDERGTMMTEDSFFQKYSYA